jgi:hypothetical protein
MNNQQNYRRELELIHDLIHFYDRRQFEYNRNVGNIITLLTTFLERNREPYELRENLPYRHSTPSNRRSSPGFSRQTFSNSPFFSYLNRENPGLRENPRSRENPGLSYEQIEQSTISLLYTRDMQYSQCPISFEDFTLGEEVIKIRFCGHIFKPDSIQNWFRRNCRCPVCRYDLSSFVPTPSIPVREFNVDISLNRLPSLEPLTDIETSIVQNINRILQGIDIPEENGETNQSTISRYVFEFPIYYDVSNNS